MGDSSHHLMRLCVIEVTVEAGRQLTLGRLTVDRYIVDDYGDDEENRYLPFLLYKERNECFAHVHERRRQHHARLCRDAILVASTTVKRANDARRAVLMTISKGQCMIGYYRRDTTLGSFRDE